MKKIILNDWTFVLTILVFLSVCFISTHFSNNDVYDIVINFFGIMLLVSLVISMLITKLISKHLKFIVYGFFVLMLVLSMTSCGTTRSGHFPDGHPCVKQSRPNIFNSHW